MVVSHHLLAVAQLAVAVSAAMSPAVAVSVANPVSVVASVAHPVHPAAALFVPPALVVVQQVELVAVAMVESVEQVQVARLVQHSLQHLVDLAERMKLRDHHHHSRAATCHRLALLASLAHLRLQLHS
ncbi:MAG: hypothetical protein EBT09_13495 [Actinobacteria bacterium]|nr:hypothetical protein [Actinomycetota bacterium]